MHRSCVALSLFPAHNTPAEKGVVLGILEKQRELMAQRLKSA